MAGLHRTGPARRAEQTPGRRSPRLVGFSSRLGRRSPRLVGIPGRLGWRSPRPTVVPGRPGFTVPPRVQSLLAGSLLLAAAFGLLFLGPVGAAAPGRLVLAPQSHSAAVAGNVSGHLAGHLAAWSRTASAGEDAAILARHLTSSGISLVFPVADWGIGVLALASLTAAVMSLSGRRRQH